MFKFFVCLFVFFLGNSEYRFSHVAALLSYGKHVCAIQICIPVLRVTRVQWIHRCVVIRLCHFSQEQVNNDFYQYRCILELLKALHVKISNTI